METDDLVRTATQDAARASLGELTLHEIQARLEQAIARSAAGQDEMVAGEETDG